MLQNPIWGMVRVDGSNNCNKILTSYLDLKVSTDAKVDVSFL